MLQSVLVTGASSGIGEACAVHLAHKGFRVYAAARRMEKLRALESLAGGRITAVALDVTDAGSVRAAVRSIEDAGPLFGLVNNAGVSIMGPLETVPLEEWRRQYETNIIGMVAVTQAVLPGMRAAGRGRIVNVGSVAGRIAAPFQGAYASSKHAVEGLSDSLRRELHPFGLKVSVIRPGFINTPFGEQEQAGLQSFLDAGDPYAEYLTAFKEWHARGHPNAPPPIAAAEAVCAALTDENPRAHYVAPSSNRGALLMRKMLPASLTDALLRRIMKMPKGERKR